MRTLDNWAHRLLELPLLIECPSMQVIGYDGEDPLFTGPGHISIKSASHMEFMMHGHPAEAGLAFDRLMQARNNPYVNLDQLRVIAVDYEGVEWNCGWVDVDIGEVSQGIWHLSGSIQGIMTLDRRPSVRTEAGAELIYEGRLNVPVPMMSREKLRNAASYSDEFSGGHATHHQVVEVDGGKVIFYRSELGKQLWVTASDFSGIEYRLLENWLGEPLNILLGQIVYPRLVARNMGDGSAQVSLRKISERTADPCISSLHRNDGRPQRFWELYALILRMIVRANDDSRDSDHHRLTHYYQEISQASLGSNWVLCMTLASVIEGVTRMMPLDDEAELESDDEVEQREQSIKSLVAHLDAWEGEEWLRERLMNSLRTAQEKGVIQLLKSFRDAGVINKKHLDVWLSVRNRVMHGHLVSPWRTEDTDKKLKLLVEMVHRVSEAYIRKCVSVPASV